jgi:N-acetylglucosaminyldiphosphoundecaprenol N-acetyl-beta-D-mannosaminyltransferase
MIQSREGQPGDGGHRHAISSRGTLSPHQSTCPIDAPEVWIRGARLHAITESQCVALMLSEIEEQRGGSIITMNLDHLRRFVTDPSYAALCDRARVVTADGMPLIWASRLQGTPLPERVTGSNLIWSLSGGAAGAQRSIYLIGGAPETARKTAGILTNRYPGLRIAGVSAGRISIENDRGELQELSKAVAAARPDIVYVALSSPKQEQVIDRLRQEFPATWWVGVGIAFSFVTGDVRRAPLWMRSAT